MDIIHKDLKSANILISKDANNQKLYKIAEFGLSRFVGQEKFHAS